MFKFQLKYAKFWNAPKKKYKIEKCIEFSMQLSQQKNIKFIQREFLLVHVLFECLISKDNRVMPIVESYSNRMEQSEIVY